MEPIHPTARLPQSGEGEQLSAAIDEDLQRAEEAKAEEERDRLDTEAAIKLAIALSTQQSQPSTLTTPPAVPSASPRPASPTPLPATSSAAASQQSDGAALPDLLHAFEAELAVAEAEARERSAEEINRLTRIRRAMEEEEDDDRLMRLEVLKQRRADSKRKREQQQTEKTSQMTDRSEDSNRRKHSRLSGSDSVSAVDDNNTNSGDDVANTDLMAELDGMFDWRRQQR